MKKFKVITIILCFIFLFSSITACNSDNPSEVPSEKPSGKEIDNDNTVIQKDDIMVADGKTDYKVVIPAEPLSYEEDAVYEFVGFMETATGVSFPVIKDADLTYDDSAKYISLGRTSILTQSGVVADKKELGETGYVIKSVGKSVFICGGGAMGTLYGVYDFLHLTVGWEYYSGTEIAINELTKLNFIDFNVKNKPCFEYPYLSTVAYLNETNGSKRRRCAFSPFIPNGMHNSFILINPDEYKAEHPDWFAIDASGNSLHQLNYTAGEGLVNEMVKKLVEKLEESYLPENYKSEQILLFVGQEDYWGWDRRPESVALYNNYGTDAASLIIFINQVAEKIETWVNENQPGRKVYICTFAYMDTVKPPVKYDTDGNLVLDENGKPVPIDEQVKLRDNVVVRLAPIEANWYEPFYSESNKNIKQILDGWNALGKSIYYLYSIGFSSYYAQFNNFNSLQENYKFIYETYAPINLYDQYLSAGTNNPCFRDYRVYMQGKLMWDVYLDWEATTIDFFNNYYRDAAPVMLNYLEELRLLYMDRWKEVGLLGDCNSANLYLPELWSRGVLLKWMDDFDTAFNSIEHYRTSNPQLYKKLYERIEMETLSVRYLLIRLYGDTVYTASQLYEEKVDFYNLVVYYDMLPKNAGYSFEDLKSELGI